MPELNSEIKETTPQGKVLFLEFNPGANSEPSLRIAKSMFIRRASSIEEISNTMVSRVVSPSGEVVPDLVKRESLSVLALPESIYDCKAVVITGTAFAAYPRDRFLVDWKKELFSFLRAAVEKEISVLGICFGAQALAEALGGKVVKMRSQEGNEPYETGWARIHKAPSAVNDPVLKDLPDSFIAPENHQDIIACLPEGAVLLAENEYGVQGFRVHNAWGFQFHPERSPKVVENILRDQTRREKMIALGQNPDQVLELGKEYSGNIKTIFSNFLRFAWSGVQ